MPPYQLDHSLLTKAILNSGFDWEVEVLATYLIDSAVIAQPPPDNPRAAKTSCVHTALQTIESLRNAPPASTSTSRP